MTASVAATRSCAAESFNKHVGAFLHRARHGFPRGMHGQDRI
jgi:hypothetical protein